METTNTTSLAYSPNDDSLVPGYCVSDLPIVSAIRNFRRAMMAQNGQDCPEVQAAAYHLLDTLDSAIVGTRMTPRRIRSVSISSRWEPPCTNANPLVICVVDGNGYPWEYVVSNETLLSKDPGHAESVQYLRERVKTLEEEETTVLTENVESTNRLLEAARAKLKELESTNVEK